MTATSLRNPFRISRRAALAGLLALCATNAGVSVAFAQQTPVRFSLEGRIEGPAALFYLPLDKGYFAAEKLDVRIDPAAIASEPITRVATGEADMAIADINALITWRDQNPSAPVKAVFIVYNKPPYAVLGRKSRGIGGPKSLEGKRIGSSPGIATHAQWPLFAKVAGIDTGKVPIDNIAAALRAPMLAAGQIDAVLGYSFTTYVNLKDRGVSPDDIVLLQMADLGLTLYGSAIIVNTKFAAEKPDAVKGFLRALTKSIRETVRKPSDTADTLLERNDLATRTTALERIRMAIRDNILTPEVKANGYGGIDAARLDAAIEQIATVYSFKNKARAAEVFDPSFLPSADERRSD